MKEEHGDREWIQGRQENEVGVQYRDDSDWGQEKEGGRAET